MGNEKEMDVKELMTLRSAVLEEIKKIDTCLEPLPDEFVNIIDTQNKDGLAYFRALVRRDKGKANWKAWYSRNTDHREKKKAYLKEYYVQNKKRKKERDKMYEANQKTDSYIREMMTRRGTSPNIEF